MICDVNKTTPYMNIPVHVAIIPDGNRRWARQRNLPDIEGHRVSAEKVLPKIIEFLGNAGVKYFTFWALSTENATKRSKEEYSNLLKLMKFFLNRKVDALHKNNICIKIIGNTAAFSPDMQDSISRAIDKTKNNDGMTVIFAVNYGGRDEIVRAIHKAASADAIDGIMADSFGQFLDTSGIPDPDLIIRTGGEKRVSGFMLWQSEYAEYAFLDKLFPDFNEEDFHESIVNFEQRERRFGK